MIVCACECVCAVSSISTHKQVLWSWMAWAGQSVNNNNNNFTNWKKEETKLCRHEVPYYRRIYFYTLSFSRLNLDLCSQHSKNFINKWVKNERAIIVEYIYMSWSFLTVFILPPFYIHSKLSHISLLFSSHFSYFILFLKPQSAYMSQPRELTIKKIGYKHSHMNSKR